MKISINKNNIKNNGKQILENFESLSSDIKKVEGILENINIVWEGADALKYVNAMKNKYIKEFDELLDEIKIYGEYLSNVPVAYELLDESFANKNINV